MRLLFKLKFLAVLMSAWFASVAIAADAPHLATQGSAKQLIVEGKPFLILGGELANSSASNLGYLQAQWPILKSTGLNTVIAPVEWDQIEPVKDHYDFTIVDGMIRQARQNNFRIVLLWFGAWKNSMSTYAPPFIKHDFERYAKAQDDKGQPQDILSPFDPDTLEADKKAFSALMAHLKKTDTDQTVIMVQVENEIGMLPVVRDYGPQAEAAYKREVPQPLIAYLKANREALNPYVRSLWAAQGFKETGTWSEVFGSSIEAQEVFQAWYFAVFSDALTRAGKDAYPLPMYVNVALNRPGKVPGQYPSAGPLPHLFDIWKAGGPNIDLIAIDSYFPDYVVWANKFRRKDNPFFIPEANQAGRPEAGANAFYSIGQLDAIGFSPFAIDRLTKDNNAILADAYDVLAQLKPQILAAQGTGRMRGFRSLVSYDGVIDEAPQSFELGGYCFTVNFVEPFTPKDKQNVAANGGLIIQTGDNEFLVAGSGITLTFEDTATPKMAVGIEQIVEGKFAGGVWKPGRWLNGDESHQGRHLRIGGGKFGIQKLTLYKYR